jgi:hypothetical protein
MFASNNVTAIRACSSLETQERPVFEVRTFTRRVRVHQTPLVRSRRAFLRLLNYVQGFRTAKTPRTYYVDL